MLRQRETVDDDDIDDIIGIAQELQNELTEAASDPTVDEVRAVADELDIDPSLVDQAIEVLAQRRAAAAEAARVDAAEDAVQSRRTRTGLLIGGGVLATVLVGLMIVLGGTAVSGASSIDRAQARVSEAEVALDVVLDRQASLVPQLMALAGAQSAELETLAAQVRDAEGIDARLDASERLGAAMPAALSRLSGEGAAEQTRLDLQHEIVGAQNRITTERRRLESARAGLEQARGTMSGQLAESLGM